MKLLIIEDEKDMADSLKERLETSYIVEVAYLGRKGIYKALKDNNDLIILDLVLPDMNGREVCRELRQNGISTPILILTGQSELGDKVTLLDTGADDYLVKPFEFPELLARIRALLRRRSVEMASKLITVGDLTMDLTDRIVKRSGEIIKLRRKEFDILEYLLLNRGRLITRSMLLNHVWESESEPFDNTVDVHIKYLRDRIDKPYGSRLIKTVHGLGYRIEN
jgi:two-component system, OmpR family, response regulator